MSRYKKELKVTIGLILDHFWSQTNIASFHIGFDVFPQTWLIVFLADKLFGFINFKITCKEVIMVSTDQLKTDDFWYIR